MPRPRKATVDYFPHFVNHGKTMYIIRNLYGNDGYAFWFILLEVLASTENHFIDCNDPNEWEYLLAKTKTTSEKAAEILDKLSSLDAIRKDFWNIKIIRSDNFISNLESVYNRREVSVISNPELWDYCIQNEYVSKNTANKNPQRRGEESKGKESEEKKSEEKDIELPDFFNNEDFKNLLDEFKKHRKKIKKPMTDVAVTKLINKLAKMSNKKSDIAIEIMEQSIINGWQGIFELKNKKRQRNLNWETEHD